MIMAKNNLLIAMAVAVLLIAVISGCAKQQNGNSQDGSSQEKGVLQGKVAIGPICPVERIPPDPSCQPTEETYKGWPIAVWTADKNRKVALLEPNADGTFRTLLAAGNYIVDYDKTQSYIGKQNLPATVTIKPGETTTLDIRIDTGIR